MTDHAKLTVERILRIVTPIALVAGVAVLWDISGTLREIRTNMTWMIDAQKDHETRIRVLEAK